MHSSATTAFRALTMLACMVGITMAAMSGTSWSQILEKYRNLDWPSILSTASASTKNETGTPGLSEQQGSAGQRPMAGRPVAGVRKVAATPGKAAPASAQPEAPLGSDQIQLRLRELGATYYLLEAWGNGQQLYRFSCRMAIGGNSDLTRYFEAVDVDSQQAMQQVLRQVETWRGR